ncbi:MAG TPA: ATP-binding protein [Myxococcales bacterium]|nr:ATP-binding protein [Myxococcales bacterium]
MAGSALTLAVFAAMVAYAAIRFSDSAHLAGVAAANALPSTERLTEARTHLRDLNSAMDGALLDRMNGRPPDRHLLEEAQGRVLTELAAYEALPFYPGERSKYAAVEAARQGLAEALATMLDLLDEGSLAAVHTYENREWRQATDRLDGALEATLLFNVARLGEHVDRVRRIAQQAFLILVLAGLMSLALAIAATARAVQAIRRHERQLEDRAAEWEMFSARAAHDLLSPLQAVDLGLHVACRESKDERVLKAGALGLSALSRMKTTADALLEFARSGGRPTDGGAANAAQVIAALVEELQPEARAKRIELVHEPLPEVSAGCPPGILGVILSNLVKNALKFMGDRPERRVVLRVAAEGRRARFEVLDTGPGLPAGAAADLFEPFARRAPQSVPGVGLGLATVKRLAEAYGGTVGARSRREGGAVFWVQLPLARGRPASGRRSAPATSSA